MAVPKIVTAAMSKPSSKKNKPKKNNGKIK